MPKLNIVIEEAYEFLSDPKMGNFIAGLYRSFNYRNREALISSIEKSLKDYPIYLGSDVDMKDLKNTLVKLNEFNGLILEEFLNQNCNLFFVNYLKMKKYVFNPFEYQKEIAIMKACENVEFSNLHSDNKFKYRIAKDLSLQAL